MIRYGPREWIALAALFFTTQTLLRDFAPKNNFSPARTITRKVPGPSASIGRAIPEKAFEIPTEISYNMPSGRSDILPCEGNETMDALLIKSTLAVFFLFLGIDTFLKIKRIRLEVEEQTINPNTGREMINQAKRKRIIYLLASLALFVSIFFKVAPLGE